MKNYIYKKDRLKMTSLNIVYDAGSEHETGTNYKGCMHLMEHLLCKTFKDMYSIFTANGIKWNAGTREDMVYVWFEGLASRFTHEMKIEILKKLTDTIECVTKEEFETEKNVVLQEYFDTIIDDASADYMNMMRIYWNNFTPIGCSDDIKSFTYDDMLNVYEKYFKHPARIVEVGPEQTKELELFCEEPVMTWFNHNKPKFGYYKNPLVDISGKTKTPVYMLFPKTVLKKDYPYLRVGMSMLTEDLDSPYYKALRVDSGLSYYVLGNIEKHISGGMMYVCACTDTMNAGKLEDTMIKLSENVYDHLTKERFETVMEGMKVGREMEKVLKYMYTQRHTNISTLKMPNDLNKIEFEDVCYVMSRYFADVKVIRGNF